MKLIAEGFTTPEIANKLSRAKSTIDTHRRNLLTKLNLKNSFQLVRYAMDNGYLEKSESP